MDMFKINKSLNIVIAFFIVTALAAIPFNVRVDAVNSASMYFVQKNVANNGSVVNVDIYVDSAGSSVNAVQSDLTFDQTKLSINTVETTNSAFNISVIQTNDANSVSIVRGLNPSRSGKLLIATLKFNVLGTGYSSLTFQNSSSLYDSVNNLNILSSSPALQINAVEGNINSVFRMSNYITKERLFTTDANERDYALTHYPGWVFDGVSFFTFTTQAQGTSPVFRMSNYITKERLFTTDANERDYALTHYPGWVFDGVSFYMQ